MTEQSPEFIDAVRALVAERHRYDEWLASLEARRGDTPAHVYDRVFGDYSARRTDVLDKLTEHVPGLEAHSAELTAQLDLLDTRLQAAHDERAEAQLRHAVGEFDDSTWEDVRGRVEDTLGGLGTEREALLARHDDVVGLLDNARPPAPPDAEPVPEEVAAPDADSVEAYVSAGDAALAAEMAAAESDAGQAAADGVDGDGDAGLLDLETVSADGQGALDDHELPGIHTGAPAAVDGEATAREAAAAADVNDASEARERGERQWFETLGGDETPPTAEVLPPSPLNNIDAGLGSLALPVDAEPSDVFGDVAAPRHPTPPYQPAPPTPPRADEAFDDLAFLRSVIDPTASSPSAPANPGVPRGPAGTEPQKTLRCTECGTMNLPTEWYCERCGGELAAF